MTTTAEKLVAVGMTPELAKVIADNILSLDSLTESITVGVDGTGHDVTFYSATSGKKFLWDESADELVITGSLSVSDKLTLDGAVVGSTVTIAIAASATTDGMDITITVKDGAGNTVAAAHQLEIWMSDAATGIGLTADTFTGDLTASVGAILSAHTAKKHWSVITAATGIFTATLVDSNNPADVYVACKSPLGNTVVVSDASGTSWEGV